MNQELKKAKAIIELGLVNARINELERAKTYMSNPTYYRNRLRSLEEKAETLQNVIDGRDNVQEIKLTFNLSQHDLSVLGQSPKPEDFVQFLKKEFLVLE